MRIEVQCSYDDEEEEEEELLSLPDPLLSDSLSDPLVLEPVRDDPLESVSDPLELEELSSEPESELLSSLVLVLDFLLRSFLQ